MSGSTPRPGPTTALDAALERVGDRWSFLLVEALLEGPLHFNELRDRVPGIAPNILTSRLRRLERERVIAARPYSERPARMAYGLTQEGHELAGVLRLLASWGSGGGEAVDGLRHLACGSPLAAHWFCPTCERVVDEADASTLRYA